MVCDGVVVCLPLAAYSRHVVKVSVSHKEHTRAYSSLQMNDQRIPKFTISVERKGQFYALPTCTPTFSNKCLRTPCIVVLTQCLWRWNNTILYHRACARHNASKYSRHWWQFKHLSSNGYPSQWHVYQRGHHIAGRLRRQLCRY